MGAKPQTLTRTYVGFTFEEATARFEADCAEAARHGWYAYDRYWAPNQPDPTLVVTYQDQPVTIRTARRRASLGGIALVAVAVAVVIAIALVSGDQDPAADPSPRTSTQPAVLDLPSATPRTSTPVGATPRPPQATPAPSATRGPPEAPSVAPATPGKYEQTWPRAYSETTCHHWMNEMDAHERFVMAAHLLATAHIADGSMEDPPDWQVRSQRNAINGFCREEGVGSQRIPEVAAAIYLLADDLKP